MADFDVIADEQGWNERTCLGLCREFISKAGLQDDFNRFAAEKQEEELVAGEEIMSQLEMAPDDCEFEQRDTHEWFCTAHQVLMLGSATEPTFCSKAWVKREGEVK